MSLCSWCWKVAVVMGTSQTRPEQVACCPRVHLRHRYHGDPGCYPATCPPARSACRQIPFLIPLLKNRTPRTFLVAQWLRHHTATARGRGSVPGQGTKITQCMLHCVTKNRGEKDCHSALFLTLSSGFQHVHWQVSNVTQSPTHLPERCITKGSVEQTDVSKYWNFHIFHAIVCHLYLPCKLQLNLQKQTSVHPDGAVGCGRPWAWFRSGASLIGPPLPLSGKVSSFISSAGSCGERLTGCGRCSGFWGRECCCLSEDWVPALMEFTF